MRVPPPPPAGGRVLTLLRERFERPTPIQAQSWPLLLAGHAPGPGDTTGGGGGRITPAGG